MGGQRSVQLYGIALDAVLELERVYEALVKEESVDAPARLPDVRRWREQLEALELPRPEVAPRALATQLVT